MMEGIIKFDNGKQYTGHWHGETNHIVGEVVFYTGMGNFIEFMTDPALKDKIVITTYPGIFQADIDPERFESEGLQLAALITPQEFLASTSITKKWMTLFKENSIPILSGVDTRSMIKDITLEGETNATLLVAGMNEVIAQRNKHFRADQQVINPSGHKHLVVLNFGIRRSLIKWLKQLGYKLTILSGDSRYEDIEELNPDGIIFSGGAGSPFAWSSQFDVYRKVAKQFPVIGFGLGHQILAVIFGAKVEKMKCGHRNFRQPIIHNKTKTVYLSNQNHNYTVSIQSLEKTGYIPSFFSVQDGSIEGLVHNEFSITTYQFHPDGKNSKLEALIKATIVKQLEEKKGVSMYA